MFFLEQKIEKIQGICVSDYSFIKEIGFGS